MGRLGCHRHPDHVDFSMQAHGPFLFIALVGVQPALQCRGIGSGLLRRVLRYADEHSLPFYLEVCCEWYARSPDKKDGKVQT
jgi:GNAT superfamily N-acetyltransferase